MTVILKGVTSLTQKAKSVPITKRRETTSHCAVPELVHKLSPFHCKAAIAGRGKIRHCFVNAIGHADAQRCTFKDVHGCLNDSGAGQRQNMQHESSALFFPL